MEFMPTAKQTANSEPKQGKLIKASKARPSQARSAKVVKTSKPAKAAKRSKLSVAKPLGKQRALKPKSAPQQTAPINDLPSTPAPEPALPVVKAIPDEVLQELLGDKKPVIEASASDDVDDLARLNTEDVKLTPKIRISKVSDLSSAVEDYANKSMYNSDYVVDLKSKRNYYVDDADDMIDEEIQAVLGQPMQDLSRRGQPSVEDALGLPIDADGNVVQEGLKQELLEAISGSTPVAASIIDEATLEASTKPKDAPVPEAPPLVEAVPETPEAPATPVLDLVQKQHKVKIFKRIALAFSVLVLLVLLGVLYFVSVKMTITVALKEEQLADKLAVPVYDRPAEAGLPEKTLRGVVKRIDIEQSKLYQVGGTEVIGEEVIGQITLFNKYNKSQPLVASTRLLSASGKLFRLKNAVTVPAGSSIVAEVYADQAKPDQVIGAELFTVPGLWEGIQDKIYGESQADAIKYQQKIRRIISQEDIDKAVADLKVVIVDKVKADIDNSYDDFNHKIYQLDPASLEFKASGKIGDEQEQLPVSLKGTVQVIAFSTKQAEDLIKQQVSAKLLAGQELVGLVPENTSYEVVNIDTTTAMAELAITYSAKLKPSTKSNIIDKNKIIGLSDNQLKQYLKNQKQIESFSLEYYPKFIKQVPRLADRITIKVNQ